MKAWLLEDSGMVAILILVVVMVSAAVAAGTAAALAVQMQMLVAVVVMYGLQLLHRMLHLATTFLQLTT